MVYFTGTLQPHLQQAAPSQTSCLLLNFWTKSLNSPERKSHISVVFLLAVVQSLSHVQLFADCSMPDFPGPHGLQHARLPCPSLSPGICSNSCPLSQWCQLSISSSATLFSFCLQSFPASGSFLNIFNKPSILDEPGKGWSLMCVVIMTTTCGSS